MSHQCTFLLIYLHVLHSVDQTTIFPKSYCGVLMSMRHWGYQLECLWGM